MFRLAKVAVVVVLVVIVASSCWCEGPNPGHAIRWRFSIQDSLEFAKPDYDDSAWQEVSFRHKWKSSKFAWFRARVSIPEIIDGQPTDGQAVGIRWNAGDGGECFVGGKICVRYDNDHPALIVLSENARQGDTVSVAVRVFTGADDAEHEAELGQCDLVIIDPKLVKEPFEISVDAAKCLGPLPRSFAGMSQGGGLGDYSDEFVRILRDLGIKWFRMDNLLTNALKKNEDGTLCYDWTDLDRRLDFMKKVGCELIFCISYMPEPLDAVPDPNRHSYPRDWDEFGELVYQAAKHAIERGTPVKYWEVWNEINTGWMVDPPGWDHLKTYLTLYDTCWKAVRRADPNAWIGGPAIASGPWDENDPRGPGVNGEKFMRGLLKHCETTGAPLDFISWHEYFQPHWIMKKEAEQIREYLNEYPKVKAQVKEFVVTEWSYAWWHDRAHDNELGAAWAAASMLRGWMAAGVEKPCWFYARDGCWPPCGDWGMFAANNKPKPVANVCRMFNVIMAPEKVDCLGEDDQIASIGSIDPDTGRLTVLIVNFAERYGSPRKIRLSIRGLSAVRYERLKCRRYIVDATHSNLWNDESRCELESVPISPAVSDGLVRFEFDMPNNCVTLVEIYQNRQ
ncbi:MAG: GH39 family glycosyl hydrolase [Armatimonadota bacterium]